MRVSGQADPTFEQNLVVQVTDAGGAVLATQSTTIQADAGQRGTFDVDLAFTSASDQPGRVSVYSTSARDGGLLHMHVDDRKENGNASARTVHEFRLGGLVDQRPVRACGSQNAASAKESGDKQTGLDL